MKIVRFWDGDSISYGVLEDEKIAMVKGNIYGSHVVDGTLVDLEDVQLLAPCEPSKIVCIGLNYHDHAKEMSLPVPKEPVVFLKPPSSITGPDTNVIHPPQCKKLDYEAELAVVIGDVTRNVEPEETSEKILGYTCANDVTARDLQPRDGQWTLSKSFDTFCPIGPYIKTDIKVDSLAIKLFLNGQLKQNSNTSEMIFSIPFLISYISKIMTLFPGDIIITGTPSGIGSMEPGDTVTVDIEGIGNLNNKVTVKC